MNALAAYSELLSLNALHYQYLHVTPTFKVMDYANTAVL